MNLNDLILIFLFLNHVQSVNNEELKLPVNSLKARKSNKIFTVPPTAEGTTTPAATTTTTTGTKTANMLPESTSNVESKFVNISQGIWNIFKQLIKLLKFNYLF